MCKSVGPRGPRRRRTSCTERYRACPVRWRLTTACLRTAERVRGDRRARGRAAAAQRRGPGRGFVREAHTKGAGYGGREAVRIKAALLQNVLDLVQLRRVPAGQAPRVLRQMPLGAVAVRARRREPPHEVLRLGRKVWQHGTRGQVPPQPRPWARSVRWLHPRRQSGGASGRESVFDSVSLQHRLLRLLTNGHSFSL